LTWNNKEKIKNVIKRKQQEVPSDTTPALGERPKRGSQRLAVKRKRQAEPSCSPPGGT